MNKRFTAILRKEDNMYVALCPELDIASQGQTLQEAKANLIEALSLFFECASETEIAERLAEDFFITPVEVAVG